MSQLKQNRITNIKQAIINYLDSKLDSSKIDLTELTHDAIFQTISKQDLKLELKEFSEILEEMMDKKNQDLRSIKVEIEIYYPPARVEKLRILKPFLINTELKIGFGAYFLAILIIFFLPYIISPTQFTDASKLIVVITLALFLVFSKKIGEIGFSVLDVIYEQLSLLTKISKPAFLLICGLPIIFIGGVIIFAPVIGQKYTMELFFTAILAGSGLGAALWQWVFKSQEKT